MCFVSTFLKFVFHIKIIALIKWLSVVSKPFNDVINFLLFFIELILNKKNCLSKTARKNVCLFWLYFS